MDHLRQRAAPKATTVSSKKKAAGSDLSSTRGSEERNSSVPATGRGQKRGRDFEIEKVGDVSSPSRASSVSSNYPPLGPFPESSPGLPGLPQASEGNNITANRSPPDLSSESSERPAKFLRVSPASEDGKPADENLSQKARGSSHSSSPSSPSSPPPKISFSLSPPPQIFIPESFIRGSPARRSTPSPSPPPPAPLRSHSSPALPPSPKLPSPPPAALLSLSEDVVSSSSSEMSSAPPSPNPTKVGPGRPRRGRSNGKKTKWEDAHEIFGHAIIGTKHRSRNDPMGIHVARRDYPCGKLHILFHDRPEYPRPEFNPYGERHQAIRDDPRACAAKRHFFDVQDPPDVLMIAGIPLDEKHILDPTRSDSEPPGRKPPASKKKSPPQKKGKVDNSPLQEEAFHSRPSVRIVVPDHLKSILVDDWENVTKNLSLVPLPSAHPVNEILTTYFDEEKGKRRLGSAEADLLEEVVSGVKEYFEKCLGRILLYRFEREQFFEIRQLWEHGVGEWEGKGAGDVYGAEHLCRLFGKLDLSFLPYLLWHSAFWLNSDLSFLSQSTCPNLSHKPTWISNRSTVCARNWPS